MRTKAAKRYRLQRQRTQRCQAEAKRWRRIEGEIISRTQSPGWAPLTREQVNQLKADIAYIHNTGVLFI